MTVIASLGGLAIYSWVFSAYILAATISMPLWGRLADLYGRRAVYLTGLGIFLGPVRRGSRPRWPRRSSSDPPGPAVAR
jgi:MFS family permease